MIIKQLREIKNLYPDICQVTWLMNNICSNACTYCIPSLYAGTNHGYDWNNAKKFVNYILTNKKKSHWSVSGGEPTMSPFFKEFVKMVSDAGSTVGITTNGVKPTYYLVDIAEYLEYMAFSYHPEFSNDDEIIEKLLACNLYTKASIRIMLPANQPHWDKSIKFIKRLSKLKSINYETVRVLPYSDNISGPIAAYTYDYSEEQLAFFDNSISKGWLKPNNRLLPGKPVPIDSKFIHSDGTSNNHSIVNAVEYINRGFGDFRKWKCSAGLESLFVSYNGNIQKANCQNDPIIGHLDRPDDIKWPREWTTCKLSICSCSTDFILSKKKVKELI